MSIVRRQYTNNKERLENELSDILVPYNINIFSSTCDVFEEIILKIAGIEEKPKGCCFYPGTRELLSDNSVIDNTLIYKGDDNQINMDWMIICYTISPEAFHQLITSLNSRFPSLEISDVTDLAPKLQIKTEINGYPAYSIKLKTEEVCIHLLPLIATYLQYHSEAVTLYAENTFKFSQLEKINKAFEYNVGIHETGLFGQTLWIMVMMQNLISDALTKNLELPSGILSIITQYLFVDMEMQIDPLESTVKILSTLMKENSNDCYSSDVYFTVEPKSNEESTVNSIANLLKCIGPVTVRKEQVTDPGDDKKSDLAIETDNNDRKTESSNNDSKEQFPIKGFKFSIKTSNGSLINTQFLDALTKAQQHFSQIQMNMFNKASNKDEPETVELITKLKVLYTQLQSNEEFKNTESITGLLIALNAYISFVVSKKYRLNEESEVELLELASKVEDELENLNKERGLGIAITIEDMLGFSFENESNNNSETDTADAKANNENETIKKRSLVAQENCDPAYPIVKEISKLLMKLQDIAQKDALDRSLKKIHDQTYCNVYAKKDI